MPVESTINHDKRLVLTRCYGAVTIGEVVEDQNRLLTDPKFNSDYDLLVDHTATDTFLGNVEEWAFVIRQKFFSETSFVAHVATRDNLFEFLRLGNAYHEIVYKNQFAQVFSDEGIAKQWLSEMRSKRETGTLPIQKV